MLIRWHSIGLITMKIGIVDFMGCGSGHCRTFKFALNIATGGFFTDVSLISQLRLLFFLMFCPDIKNVF